MPVTPTPVAAIRSYVAHAESGSVAIVVSDWITVAIRVGVAVVVAIAVVRGRECGANQGSGRKANTHAAPSSTVTAGSDSTPVLLLSHLPPSW